MIKFKLNKLVRDKLPANYEQLNQQATIRKLTGEELRTALLRKIIEEANELSKEEATTVVEVADLEQALDDLIEITGLSKEEIKKAKEEKEAKKGRFLEGSFVEFLELHEDDEWVQYYRQEPELFPEITNSEEQLNIPEIEKGEYVHVKSGKKYEVLGVACHSETLEPLVIYKPLYEHEGLPDVWVRPYEMFFEEVDIDGIKRARFEKIELDEAKKDT